MGAKLIANDFLADEKRAPSVRTVEFAVVVATSGYREPLPSRIGATHIQTHAVEACHPHVKPLRGHVALPGFTCHVDTKCLYVTIPGCHI